MLLLVMMPGAVDASRKSTRLWPVVVRRTCSPGAPFCFCIGSDFVFNVPIPDGEACRGRWLAGFVVWARHFRSVKPDTACFQRDAFVGRARHIPFRSNSSAPHSLSALIHFLFPGALSPRPARRKSCWSLVAQGRKTGKARNVLVAAFLIMSTLCRRIHRS